MEYQDHIGSHWIVTLPADWRLLSTSPHGVDYFGSADENFGLYIAVWDVHDAQREPNEVAAEFMRVSVESLNNMPEHTWHHAQHVTGVGEALLDSLERSRNYRVVRRVIAGPPLVLDASFHDYACKDLTASSDVLSPLLENVRLTG